MPIIYDSTRVIKPQRSDIISKYLDLPKFLSLLYNKSLFFCRLDILESKFEGTTAKKNYNWRIKSWKLLNDRGYFKRKLTDEDIIKNVNKKYEFEKRIKSTTCVNCWNTKSDESVALWKIYSDSGKGIMLKSQVQKIEDALKNTPEEIIISKINYIDYDNDLMQDGNLMFPIIHKPDAYHFEDEVRLIYQLKKYLGRNYDWEKEEIAEGKYIKADLNLLIEEIIIGPFSPPMVI